MKYSSKLWPVYWAIFWASKLRSWWSVSKWLAFHTEVLGLEPSRLKSRFVFLLYNSPVTNSNLCYYKIPCTGSKPWSASDIKLKVCCTWCLLYLHCHLQWQHSNSTYLLRFVLALVTSTETKVVKIHTYIRVSHLFSPCESYLCSLLDISLVGKTVKNVHRNLLKQSAVSRLSLRSVFQRFALSLVVLNMKEAEHGRETLFCSSTIALLITGDTTAFIHSFIHSLWNHKTCLNMLFINISIVLCV
jgi:hypothetical protein